MRPYKKTALAVFALVMALVLVACGGSASSSASSAASGSSASASSVASSASANASSAATAELAGKPWVTSIIQGNLPAEAPAAKDDLYTNSNYEYLAAHQAQPSSAMIDHATELQATNLTTIKDTSKSNHDLDQLRIFYNQAADAEVLLRVFAIEVDILAMLLFELEH